MLEEGRLMQPLRGRWSLMGSLLALVVMSAALVGCGGGSPSPPAIVPGQAGQAPATATEGDVREIKVIADNLKFNPSSITVQEGEGVRFTVTSKDIRHTFTFIVNGREKNLDLQAGGTKSTDVLVFDEPAEIVFWCKRHRARGMEGKLTVTRQ